MEITFDIDGYVLYNNTVSARNPPEICMDVPYLKQAASVCIKFYDMVYSMSSLSGCVEVVAKLASIKLNKIKLGCFDLVDNLVMNKSFLVTRLNSFYHFFISRIKDDFKTTR